MSNRTFEVKPRSDRILVKEIQGDNVSDRGILLPVRNEPRNVVVEVVDVGNGQEVEDIKKGSLVIVSHLYEEDKVGEQYLIDDCDILAHYQDKG